MQTSFSPVILALDTPDRRRIGELVTSTRHCIDVYKIGMEAFTALGPKAVAMVRESGKEVFLDLKFHDIPNTVAGAVRSAANLGVLIMNVHAPGGKAMLSAASSELKRWSAEQGCETPKLLAVTVLTSLERNELAEVGYQDRPVDVSVLALAGMAHECGLSGVVASPRETAAIRSTFGPDFLIVTPGVRPSGDGKEDQKRVMTPIEAIEAGSDFIVVGRPISGAEDPGQAASAICREVSCAKNRKGA